ncbi:hypothetical protein RO04_10950 [Aggregatibacter actinomycetemcomitans]|uniref:Uncharacterized protein n=1 Tax=Aggregatibacter actinomycetemcomitans TaxID=714 RepID=A0AB74N1W5_AGGAC|nr:hypothetical protein RO04_10950 [Aggregatibacter actinomycetemcomitans]PHO19674.1 hypothetical protein CQR80_10940 [Aggregatibacter actinomycetemcomitans]PHO22487.1 hypothetical protein CQR79_08190 [Aggregatibacter actinomycetemcomitans]TYA20223.1 hypothetical protein FXE08_11100 [Aggregatibacter actinomycetemcomitans]TYA38011.1 hypothetical protein FXB79_11105 [Aggregatibacter actinomycetemcomitans]
MFFYHSSFKFVIVTRRRGFIIPRKRKVLIPSIFYSPINRNSPFHIINYSLACKVIINQKSNRT